MKFGIIPNHAIASRVKSIGGLMTIKRLILIVLTVLAILFTAAALWGSWKQPQVQSRLELYQTNILLQAQEWQKEPSKNFSSTRNTLLGEQPLEAAIEQYEEVKSSAEANLKKVQGQLQQLRSQPNITPAIPIPESKTAPVPDTSRQRQEQLLQQSVSQLKQLITELDLRLGILQAQQGKIEPAINTWASVTQETTANNGLVETANVLSGLWSNPPRLLPDAKRLIQENLEGWFRYRALSQLYQLQQRQEALETLKAEEEQASQQALVKIGVISTVPMVAGLFGLGLLIYLVVQRLRQKKQSLLAQNEDVVWSTPWDAETILQVFVLGFFLMGQILVPLLFSLLHLKPTGSGVRIQALYVMASYLLVAVAVLSVLQVSVKPFLPLPEGWFKFNWRSNWILWGFGGYCVALPLVLLVSLINQKIWQGQGGSNPLLSLALSAQDTIALSIFFLTAAIAAPLFEEFLFRGFLLPSLTRYFSVWEAILLSGFLFAVAHLSLAEILPLTVLGIILGVVYTRSRNLLAPMLLHSLWNSGTLLSLFVLGSGSS